MNRWGGEGDFIAVSKSPVMFIRAENKELTLTLLCPHLHLQSPIVLQDLFQVFFSTLKSENVNLIVACFSLKPSVASQGPSNEERNILCGLPYPWPHGPFLSTLQQLFPILYCCSHPGFSLSADTQGLYTYCSLPLKYSLFTYHISSRSFPPGRLSWLHIRTDSWF